LDRRDRQVTIGAVAALAVYVGGWALAGVLADGYDPREQAISELFALGAPPLPRALLVTGLAASAVALVAFAAVLHRRLPGGSAAGPAAIAGSGVATGLILAFPCTEGCPGVGAGWTDTGHTVVATVGYALLVAGPLLLAGRTRGRDRTFSAATVIIAGGAAALYGVHLTGLAGWGPGTAQRVFNTVADLWYVFAATWLLSGRHVLAAGMAGSGGDRHRKEHST
jgi:hypothetical protein